MDFMENRYQMQIPRLVVNRATGEKSVRWSGPLTLTATTFTDMVTVLDTDNRLDAHERNCECKEKSDE